MNIILPSISMRLEPRETSSLETECLYGENVEILKEYSEWAYCKLCTDNYLGWVKKNGIGKSMRPTHRVNSNRTFIYTNKDPKSLSIGYLPMASRLKIKKVEKDWSEILLPENYVLKSAYLPTKHIVKLETKSLNWVETAEQLIETPYKWGGRNTMGIDCSALLQLSYFTYGEIIPRNTIDQINLNKQVITNWDQLDRGCVIFWKGHVGIMVDKKNCIHANAFHMKTIIEPLEVINKRMGRDNGILKILNFN